MVNNMHSFFISIVLNLSIVFAAIAGVIRFKRICSDYYPFLIIIWLGLLNELISIVFVYSFRNNAINANLFVLIEYLLLLLQFYKWNESVIKNYYLLAFLGFLIWIIDNLIINHVAHNNSLFRIFYS